MTKPLWRLSHVALSGRQRPRLDSVSVEIPPGVTALLGPSGAGKTSLLNLLVAFESPDAGSIERGLPAEGGRLPLFWVPPDLGLWPHLTVAQHVQTVAPPAADRPKRLQQLLEAFDLADKMSVFPDQLSQGERARLSLARACAAAPAVLVLDEPLVHVDPSQVVRYWAALREFLHVSEPVSLVFSTHAPEVVLREARHVVCLHAGRVSFAGPVRQLYEAPPTCEAAWALGPANWLDPSDAERWLGERSTTARCLRPEQLDVLPAPAGSLVVERAFRLGSLSELDVRDEHSGLVRRFFHRAAGAGLQAGDRVLLKVLSVVLMCLSLWGCSGAGASDAQLAAQSEEVWTMPAQGTRVPMPRAVHVTPEKEAYVLDNAGRVLVFDDQGKVLRQWEMPEFSAGRPEKILQLRDGRLAVADTHYRRVLYFDTEGHELSRMGSYGRDPGQFIFPVSLAEDDRQNLYVGEYGGNDRIQKFDHAGNFLLAFGGFGTEPGEFQRPSALVWHEGRIYVADAFNNRIQVFSDDGKFIEVLGGTEPGLSLLYPYDLALSAAGDLFVVEYQGGRVSRIDLTGRLLGRYGRPGSGPGEFASPWGLAVDQGSRVYVTDTENRRIVRVQFSR